jgi:hypothetical protein
LAIPINTPIRFIRSGCCARTVTGQNVARGHTGDEFASSHGVSEGHVNGCL